MGATMAVAGAATSVMGASQSASAQRQQGNYQRNMMEANSRIAELQAEDSIRRGHDDANKYGQQVRQTIGSQRANLAAQGIDVNSGSAIDTQAATAAIGANDQAMIRHNAWREAWGFRTQAQDMRSQGSMAMSAANNSARNTLVAGGLQAIQIGMSAYKPAAKPAQTGDGVLEGKQNVLKW